MFAFRAWRDAQIFEQELAEETEINTAKQSNELIVFSLLPLRSPVQFVLIAALPRWVHSWFLTSPISCRYQTGNAKTDFVAEFVKNFEA